MIALSGWIVARAILSANWVWNNPSLPVVEKSRSVKGDDLTERCLVEHWVPQLESGVYQGCLGCSQRLEGQCRRVRMWVQRTHKAPRRYLSHFEAGNKVDNQFLNRRNKSSHNKSTMRDKFLCLYLSLIHI